MEHSNIQSVGNCANQIKTHKDANLFKNTHGLIVLVEKKRRIEYTSCGHKLSRNTSI